VSNPDDPNASSTTWVAPGRAALDDFDRGMRFWETAHSASRQAEDRYVEVAWAVPLREETRRSRRALVLSAVVTVAMAIFHLRPTRIPALDLSIEGLQSTVLVGGAVLFTAYFWAEFLAYTSRDVRSWSRAVSVAYRELTTALGREEAQTRETYNQYARVMLRYLADCETRKDLYKTSVLGSKEPRWASVVGTGRVGRIECLLPNLIALVAILAGVWAIARETLPYLRC
jgi:hypothetical protein